jgi:hypothetical protein
MMAHRIRVRALFLVAIKQLTWPNSSCTGSVAGSDEPSPPSSRPPQSGSVAGQEQPESLCDVEDKTRPRVSLPSFTASLPTQSENRSTGRPAAVDAMPSSSISAGPLSVTSPPDAFVPVVPKDGGFPTHADTIWGDPIAAALASSSKSSTGASSTASRSAVGADTGDAQAGRCNNAEAGQGQEAKGQNAGTVNTRGARGGRKALKRGGAAAAVRASEDQDVAASVAVPAEPDVELPPRGPGGSWCADDAEW